MRTVLALIVLGCAPITAFGCVGSKCECHGDVCSNCEGTTQTSPAPPSDAGEASTDAINHSVDSADDSSTPACVWPASLDPTDASDGRCVAARTFLSCSFANGVTQVCISNDPTQCPGGGSVQPGVSFTCHDQCGPGEYGIRCGQIGPGNPTSPPLPTPPQPPAGCRAMVATPAGIGFECCPCGA